MNDETLKVLSELLDYAERHNGAKADYTDKKQDKYILAYSAEEKIIFALPHTWTTNYGLTLPLFLSPQTAIEAANAVGKARLLKYYFGENVDENEVILPCYSM